MDKDTNISIEIGKRIYERRKQLGMTQEELSELTETTPQAISNYERGERELKASTIIKMSVALKISSDFLLTGSETSLLNRNEIISPEKLNSLREIIDKCIDLTK